jgi:hypothetical protein
LAAKTKTPPKISPKNAAIDDLQEVVKWDLENSLILKKSWLSRRQGLEKEAGLRRILSSQQTYIL